MKVCVVMCINCNVDDLFTKEIQSFKEGGEEDEEEEDYDKMMTVIILTYFC
jgi:hypothetical protein